MASAVPSLLFCLVLLASPYLGSSYHTSYYTHGGKHYALRSGDALDLRSLRGEDNHGAPAPAAGPSSPGAVVSIPVRGHPMESLPGAFEYHVVVGFGTPVQEVTVGFDTYTTGATLLKCTPCAATEPCDQAFEPSASSSLAQVPCGSPDCPFRGCSGPSCTFSLSTNNTLLGNATFMTDTLTLTSSATVENFRFACLEAGFWPRRDDSTGILDLSRNSHSLASRVPSSPGTVAFSYCLPSSPNTVGFLSLGVPKPELSGRQVSYTPLRSNPGNGNLYVVELVGVRLGGRDLSVPPTAFTGDTIVDLHKTFTYLRPEVYSVLRDNFRQWMTEYKPAPPLGVLDTCYDFTGRNSFSVPMVTLKFGGGADIGLSMDGMMYFPDPKNHFAIACLAFAAAPENAREAAVIGNKAQSSMEVVYDVRGGKIGFVPYRC